MFAIYLIAELGCEPVLIGIQPVDTSMGSSLSTPVQVAIDTLVIELTESFQLSYAP
jgi:hypothetical protein